MKRRTGWSIGALGFGLAVILAWVGVASRQTETAPTLPAQTDSVEAEKPGAQSADLKQTLYCEFTNFADQNPRVGFYFSRVPDVPTTTYELIFQRERDGTQDDFGQDGSVRPRWTLDASDEPAVLHAPDESIAINLYDFGQRTTGTTWLEAGLRSTRYLNLGGKCRLSSA